ncbi:fluoride efflux transporter CrcB [Jiangella rhizosphaerae]|uniref:Fluoride-specific ion channel FluC n=1 Tax=Jiangella rhizosphaerae TaxID=2293569 RepID=A0A418KHJ9_9ACTN|nr:fluoride efflux transporter CrcB [Jiangella rhizosphaerae]RIQ11790.1 fluoride efflux transporter CrcB [Jiangella rhizosphaerae]
MSRVRRQLPVLAVIAAGGVLGALARHGAASLQPDAGTGWPWAILAVNVSGCLLIGVLMAVLLGLTAPHRLLRPFLGIGVLGGYTTFSTYAVDTQRLLVEGRYAAAVTYFLVTPVLALLAVWLGTAATRAVRGRRRA